MRKFVITAIILLAAVTAVFAVGGKEGTAASATGKSFKVGFVTDTGGIDDKSFNQSTWEGVVRFAKENGLKEGVEYKFLQSTQEADYVPNLSTLADEKMDLVVAAGFLFANAMKEVSAKYPNTMFLLIDDSSNNVPNLCNAVFAEHEGSYLVGVAAGLKAKKDGKNKVGFIGGMQSELIERFEAGYIQGVKAVNPSCEIFSDYTGDFAAPDKGKALAQKQYNAGAYIIFHAAGGSGNGMINEARERSEKGDIRWAIGVDKDQYNDGVYGNKSAILTSMMKRVDQAAYEVAKAAMNGQFPGGTTLTLTLKNAGVGIPSVNPNLDADIQATVNEYAAKIASGAITVKASPKGL